MGQKEGVPAGQGKGEQASERDLARTLMKACSKFSLMKGYC